MQNGTSVFRRLMLLTLLVSASIPVVASTARGEAPQPSSQVRAVSRIAPAANDLVIKFIRTLCLGKGDLLERAKVLYGPDWRMFGERTENDVTFAVDGPIPKLDFRSENWEGPVQGGEARIDASRYDYEDVRVQDHSRAYIWIMPDTIVDMAAVAAATSLELVLDGHAAERPGVSRTYHRDGTVTTTAPFTGRIQHYKGRITSGSGASDISATRASGAGYPKQYWRLSCGSAAH